MTEVCIQPLVLFAHHPCSTFGLGAFKSNILGLKLVYTRLIGLVATWEHPASPGTSFQTPPGGPQKLRFNPSFSQFSPCPTRCTVWASVCRFHSSICLPVPPDPVFCATMSHSVPHHFPHVSACLLLQPNPLFSVA